MARPKHSSPTLTLTITAEQYERAKQSSSGGCLIADAIKVQYPHLTRVEVDQATIRATDLARGERYIYLTPEPAQRLLLGFDQGWKQLADRVVIRRAVQIVPITRPKTGAGSKAGVQARRQARLAEMDAQLERGEQLSLPERRAYGRMKRNEAALPPPDRPSSRGVAEVIEAPPTGTPVVRGGRPRTRGDANPNLLRGRDRHFGAKMAKPGEAWEAAIEQAVTDRLGAAEPTA